MPPAAAAIAAEAMVSRYSPPGSPTSARMSTRPGQSTAPPPSIMATLSGRPSAGAEIEHFAVADQQFAGLIQAGRGIEQADVGEEDVRHVARLGH